jgi:succinyl-CoA synthetase beta subunit
MKLLEYEAKVILTESGITVPVSQIVTPTTDDIPFLPAVLKSQVPVGGRGKAGGIKIVESNAEFVAAVGSLFNLSIKGHTPRTLLAEQKLNIKHEYYISVVFDRIHGDVRIMAHTDGGIEVEQNPVDTYLRVVVGGWDMVGGKKGGNWDEIGQQLADYYDLPSHAFVLQDLVERLYVCFVDNDATLIEINPLVMTTDDVLIAGDCKMTLDDSAAFRHTWDFEESVAESNFVTLDSNGVVATIANGAGLAMATVDAVAGAGLSPANFLDIGGGANTASLLAAFHRISEYQSVKAIVINIFAGITRCDEVARAIIEAQQQINTLPPLFIRLAGTNAEQAVALLGDKNIPMLASLDECIQAAKIEVSS